MKKIPLPGDWQTGILNLYREGYSDTEVQSWIKTKLGDKFTSEDWQNWNRDYPEFNEIIKFGQIEAKAYWETYAREHLMDKAFQASTWKLVMINRFKYLDDEQPNYKFYQTINNKNDSPDTVVKRLEKNMADISVN